MKTILFASLLLTNAAFGADTAALQVSLSTDYEAGFGKVYISTSKPGSFKVYHDKNTCSTDGTCTEMKTIGRTVRPKILNDDRASDGSVTVGISDEIRLIQGDSFGGNYYFIQGFVQDQTTGQFEWKRLKTATSIRVVTKK